MPELVEVQTVIDVIEPQIVGKRINKIRVYQPSVIANRTDEEFENEMVAQVVSAVKRRGKYILLTLGSGKVMMLHLRMTCGFMVTPEEYPMAPHTHVVWTMDNGTQLRFSDQRRFGRIWLFENFDSIDVGGFVHLGLEPFDPLMTEKYLKARLSQTGRRIKECLMDQSIVAGIGNIYSDEILFMAGIHPGRRANALDDGEVKRLSEQIPLVMRYFLDKNAITAEDYLRSGGKEYRNTPYLRVYGRGGCACLACGRKLEKMRVGGRSSVYCPACQRLDGNE